MPEVPVRIVVSNERFDIGVETERLAGGRTDIGAIATFTGVCRDEAGALAALELEHYPGMAERQLERIATEACSRWPLQGIFIHHRFGRIEPGEQIVLVCTASTHREAAFDAARYVMDFLKTDAPFWKKEHPVSGDDGNWVEAKTADDSARLRWTRTN